MLDNAEGWNSGLRGAHQGSSLTRACAHFSRTAAQGSTSLKPLVPVVRTIPLKIIKIFDFFRGLSSAVSILALFAFVCFGTNRCSYSVRFQAQLNNVVVRSTAIEATSTLTISPYKFKKRQLFSYYCC